MQKIYVAYGIECGERFVSLFKTSIADKGKIREIAEEMCAGWGGECTSVKEWKPTNNVQWVKVDGQVGTSTEKQWNAYLKKVKALGANVEETVAKYFKSVKIVPEAEPKDVFDHDAEVAKDEARKNMTPEEKKALADKEFMELRAKLYAEAN